MARKPLKVTINSAGRSPHTTLRQLILNAILKIKKRGGSTKTEIRRNIEKYYNCKLGKKFLGQLGRSLNRLVKEAEIHNHYERYQVVPRCVVKYSSLGVRQKRPHCFCINPRSRTRSKRRSRGRSRSRSRSRPRKGTRRRLTGLVGLRGRRRKRRGRSRRRRSRRRRRRGPGGGNSRGRSKARQKDVTVKKVTPPQS